MRKEVPKDLVLSCPPHFLLNERKGSIPPHFVMCRNHSLPFFLARHGNCYFSCACFLTFNKIKASLIYLLSNIAQASFLARWVLLLSGPRPKTTIREPSRLVVSKMGKLLSQTRFQNVCPCPYSAFGTYGARFTPSSPLFPRTRSVQ